MGKGVLPRCRSGYRYRFRGRTHGVAVPGRNSRMRIGTERLIRALIGAGMVIGHEVGRDMTASRASRSEEHTSELQSLMRNSYAVFCLKKKNTTNYIITTNLTRDRSTTYK